MCEGGGRGGAVCVYGEEGVWGGRVVCVCRGGGVWCGRRADAQSSPLACTTRNLSVQ